MAKIIVEMEFDFDGFDKLSDIDKHGSIMAVLETSAESANAYVNVTSTRIITE